MITGLIADGFFGLIFAIFAGAIICTAFLFVICQLVFYLVVFIADTIWSKKK